MPIGIVVRVFAHGLGDWVQSQVESYQRPKMVLYPSLLNSQQCKVQIKVSGTIQENCSLSGFYGISTFVGYFVIYSYAVS